MDKYDICSRVRELNEASEAYYNTGNPIMSDTEFDNKLEELRQWEEETGIVMANSPTRNVGAKILDDIPKITHKTPMLSLAKCHSVAEIKKFASNHNLVGSIKLDGLTVRLTYKDGELIQAESRGNGIIGGFVTEHIKQFLNVPLHINKEGAYVIDGEALIKLDDFEEINKNGEYQNSRNLAAGTLSLLDMSIVKDRKMSWYAWEVVEGTNENSFFLRLAEADELGFDVVPYTDVTVENFYNLQKFIDEFICIAKIEHLPQDGVVFKFDDVKYGKSLGNTSHHFNNGIAWKAENDTVTSRLKDIEWSIGKTGVLSPVAIFNPVRIEGSTVERASLHNVSVMKELLGENPWVGQEIGVYKANLIIPAIRWGEQLIGDRYENDNYEKQFLDIPVRCPVCGSVTEIRKENNSEVLVCTNTDCDGKLLYRLNHAVSRDALDIGNLSESTIERLISSGWVKSIKDIYHLSDYKGKMYSMSGFGKKSVDKLLNNIEASRHTTFERFIYSLSIPMVGKSASKMIAQAVDYDIGAFMHKMTIQGARYFSYLSGVGDAIIKSMDTYFNKHCSDIWELSKEFEFEKPKPVIVTDDIKSLNGKTFCITGKLEHYENRDAAKKDIELHGGKVSNSVTSKTDYLVNNDINSNSSKNKTAKNLGISIITEQQLLEMIG